MKAPLLLALIAAMCVTSVSQWSQPRDIYPALTLRSFANQSEYKFVLGSQGRLIIAVSRGDSLFYLISYDQGRNFRRTLVVASPPSPIGGYPTSIGKVHGVVITELSHIYVLYELVRIDDLVAFYRYVLARSTDNGESFRKVWETRDMGGITFPSIVYTPLIAGPSGTLHFVADSIPSQHIPVYHRLSLSDTMRMWRVPFEHHSPKGAEYCDLLTEQNIVLLATSGKNASGQTRFFTTISTDSGRTFSPATLLEANPARKPRFFKRSDGSWGLMYHLSSSDQYSAYDSTIVFRNWTGGTFSERVPIISYRRYAEGQYFVAAHAGISLHFAFFYSDSMNYGVKSYEFDDRRLRFRDSIYLLEHHSPSIAVDDAGGIYMLTIRNGRLYLSTKNVTLDAGSPANIPTSISLSQNYPNPFSSSTNIRFHLPAPSAAMGQAGTQNTNYVTLKVYDLLGREVATLVDGVKEAGEHTVTFDGAGRSSGVYFYTLEANGRSLKRMVLMK